jgi:trehalose 6-phosphate synthase
MSGQVDSDGDNRLLVLANRAPLGFGRDRAGSLVARRAAGGLVATLGPGVLRSGALWVAAVTADDDIEAARSGLLDAEGFHMRAVELSQEAYRAYYDVVANQTLWFALHGLWDLPRRPRFDRHWGSAWSAFRKVNERFASEAASCAADGAVVLVQDYQLALVPAMLAALRPDLRIVMFTHTPWCTPPELAVMPDHAADELMAGMAGAMACGFHSSRWAEAFAQCCRSRGVVCPATFVAPAAADAADVRAVAASTECREELGRLDALVGDRKVVVRVDRMELSKNVLRGFLAFDELLEDRPDLRGRVVFAAKVYPSRQGVAEYLAYGQEVLTLAARLNAKWSGTERANGDAGWTPVLVDPDDNHAAAVAALLRADVLLVNPVRDGLNLVAKEGPLVNERDGVLVLSRNAGSFDELGAHALGVNPFDVTGTASAMARALDMDAAERAERAKGLLAAVEARTPLDWFDELVAAAGG